MELSKYNRREFLKTTSLTAAAMILGGCAEQGQQRSKIKTKAKPNILLIITDDQGWGDVHSHGNEVIDTPVMDKFAKEGVRFDRFFVSPVCAPTRASLLTGRYHLRTGTNGVTRGRENMRSEEVTIAEVLKDNGYVTGCFGKWHNGSNYPYHPNAQGFDEFVGFCSGHWNNYFDTTLERNGEFFKSKGYISDALTNHAMEFIEKNKNRPFFCYVPFNAPHGPYQVPDKYFDKYKKKGLADNLACVYGMCENLDDNFARLLKKLDDLRIRDNTIVIFLTDNGPQFDRYNGGMKGRKGSEHEGGVRVPLFIQWPGRTKPGETIKQITSHIDMLPTISEMCGIKRYKTKPLDGVSIVPLIDGKIDGWPDRKIYTFKFSRGGARIVPGSVRTQQYRAVRGGKKGNRWQLYDMTEDPSQKKNIAKQNRKLVKKFRKDYDKACKEATKDGFGLPIHIGYKKWPRVILPGHEAYFEKPNDSGISYKSKWGWANDWITNWTDINAYPWWDVKVVKPGRFEVTLMYICRKKNLGAKVRIEIAGEVLEGQITKAHYPKHLHSPDRVKRGEVYEKVWAQLKLGTVNLKPGKTKLIVKALSKPGKQVMDLKAVHVKKV